MTTRNDRPRMCGGCGKAVLPKHIVPQKRFLVGENVWLDTGIPGEIMFCVECNQWTDATYYRDRSMKK